MKPVVIVAALAAIALWPHTMMAAGMLGPHDLSSRGFGTSNPCSACHAPHNAQQVAMAPLWGHETTAQQFKQYSSYTRVSQSGEIGPTSKMCLSCHDGTIAIDSFFDQGTIRSGSSFMSGNRQIGHNGALNYDHPIAMTYDAALAQAKKQMTVPISDKSVDAGGAIPLFGGRMECSSCHSVHDNTFGMFLRVDNSLGKLCLTCHQK